MDHDLFVTKMSSKFYWTTIRETVRAFGGPWITMFMDEKILDDMDMAQMMGGEL